MIVTASRRLKGPGGVERRLSRRFEPHELAQPLQVIGSRLVNISRGGVMLEAPVPISTDSILRLHLVLDGERSAVEARVRACVPRVGGRHVTWGVGLEFQDLDPETSERLDRVLVPRRRSSS